MSPVIARSASDVAIPMRLNIHRRFAASRLRRIFVEPNFSRKMIIMVVGSVLITSHISHD